MSESILVVEYEPRYTDRVRQALAGHPFTASFAKDGEEALRALETSTPRLIVLSSVIPKIGTTDLIRIIRERFPLNDAPILLTVSGYTGKDRRQDAMRVGATDILPKPYTESEFLGKVQQLIAGSVANDGKQLTSNEIFGDLVDGGAVSAPRKSMAQKSDIDKLLADTLGGMMPKKGATQPGTARPHHPNVENADINKLLEDTLSGLEKKKNVAPALKPAEPALRPAEPIISPTRTPLPDRIPVSQPFIPPAPPVAAAPASEPVHEEEPADGVRFGPYVLLEKIATGGMAEVWKARKRGEEGFQKIVAIKKILPHLSDNQDFIEMFVDEAKLAAQLNHNNIIHIYDLGKIGTSYYIAMEYIDGNDLKTILRRGQERDQTLGVELALFVASKIAAALDYAHRKRGFDEKDLGLVHRDVSPQNVLISHEGDIKLCDFGIAKAASKASHTHAGALKGKLQYMSPEQAWGRSIDRRSDIFALAVVLFEMLTNRKLFLGENELSVLDQVREARVIAPSEINDEVPPNVDAIVLKGLAKEPADRYQTAGEMAKDIEAVLFDFRPTPTSADLAIFMHRLWSAQPLHMPEPEPVPVPVIEPEPRPARVAHTDSTLRPAVVAAAAAAPAADAPAATVAMPAWDAPPAPVAESRRPLMPLMFVAAIVLAIVGGFFYVRSRSGSVDALPVTQAATVVPSTAAASTPAETGTIVETTNTALTSTLAAVDTAAFAPQEPVLDPGLVQQEVQRRLAAERARLDEQARAQTATIAPQPAPVVSRPAPQPAQVATQTVPPAVQQPAPVTDTTPAQTAAVPPAVAQPATDTTPAPAVVREGDLVPAGTPGLVPARVLRRATVPYPPIARAQKIAGTVICSVLVSETGDVLDVRIIRGINRPVGLNEAAEAMMRRSSFSPPTKDGVRVKAWTTVPVDFRL